MVILKTNCYYLIYNGIKIYRVKDKCGKKARQYAIYGGNIPILENPFPLICISYDC